MRKTNLFTILFFTLNSLCCFANAAGNDSFDISSFLKKQGWEPYDSKKTLNIPDSDVAVLQYYSRGASVPSCGLLARRTNGSEFIEILGPEEGEQYPQCVGVNDVAQFYFAGKQYLAFAYADRDTRDDLYEQFFFVYKDKPFGYRVDNSLNAAVNHDYAAQRNQVPNNTARASLKASDGVKRAKAILFSKIDPKMDFLSRDFIPDQVATFAVFKNKEKSECIFLVDNGTQFKKFSSDIFSGSGDCKNFIASSRLEKDGQTYYLGMFNGASGNVGLAIFSVLNSTGEVKPEMDLSKKIIAAGSYADIKSVKKFILSH
jgi:hypothetical protein